MNLSVFLVPFNATEIIVAQFRHFLGQHVFRHTFATNYYNRSCDVKILSKLLGHADVSVTYNVYIHLYGDALEETRSVFG